jgi:hypothetical protein
MPVFPHTVIDSLTLQLIEIAMGSEHEMDKNINARRLLSLIHQRFPRSLRTAANLLSEEDESRKEDLDRLVTTLSTVRIIISFVLLIPIKTLTG